MEEPKDGSKGDANPAGETDPAPQPPHEFEPKPGDSEAVAQWRQRMRRSEPSVSD